MILVNGTELKTEVFPNGETKVREPWLMGIGRVSIVLKWESDQDLMDLLFLVDHLDDYRGYNVYHELEILYFPYSRMDRKNRGDFFTLKSVCKLINNMNFKRVTIHEPHSDVTPALLNRCEVVNTTMRLFNAFEKTVVVDYIFYPDAGAQKRYHTNRYPTLVGNKVRNPQTGKIESFEVVGNLEQPTDKFGKYVDRFPTIVIMDDLSSYGGTFMHSAKALKEMGAGDIYLIVAHTEKNIFKGEIFSSGLFKKVITTNSIINSIDAARAGILNELQIEELY